ncbi:MAG: DsbA family protein [Chloroflexi bacterium]|jgi:protein-disulfide isomerase|nr:DsbA family protein [Chloroflexota bacterium]
MTDTEPRDGAIDAGSADAPLAPAASADPVEDDPALEPVEPGDVHPSPVEVEPIAPGGPGRIARAGGYLLAAVAGGAIVALVLAAAGMLGGGTAGTPGTPGGGAAQASPTLAPSGADADAGTGAGAGAAPVLGDPAAPVLIEVWADYQCPYCGVMAHAVEPALLRDLVHTGEARLVFRDFAFLGEESVDAAAAARCAGQQGAYWRYHDLLFASQRGENQGAFGPENLTQLAVFADLDTQAFAECMDGREAHGAALVETEAGRAIDISSTPTFHIVGPKGETIVKGVTKLSEIEKAIQQTIDGTVPSPTPEAPASAPAGSAPASPAESTSPGAGGPEASPTAVP